MTTTPRKDIEKSIDSLQRLHALISALAVGDAVRRLILSPGNIDASFNFEAVPQFIAMVCTIVPFYHGMHRHLEDTYLFAKDVRHPKGVLLIDFVVFLVEACTFFALATLFKSPSFYWVLAALLFFDATWGGATALINPATKFRWCLINFFTAAAILVVLSLNVFKPGYDVWIITMIAVIRTIFDYTTHWRFYFPFGDELPPKQDDKSGGLAMFSENISAEAEQTKD